jgi:glycosyltransferase A (GT-A) superfamily protein (DUF2064 family)
VTFKKKPGTAVAIFVKTPGLSPIKTRLAGDTSKKVAEQFYAFSLNCVRAVLKEVANTNHQIVPIWAVAEEDGLSHPFWETFDSVYQGEGAFGARLSRVYTELLNRFENVIFIGADAPFITSALILDTHTLLSNTTNAIPFVLGPSNDGGFFLLGGSIPIEENIWFDVEYSVSHTGAQILERIQEFGRVHLLPPLSDVDNLKDLLGIASPLVTPMPLLKEQRELIEWIKNEF